MLLYSKNRLARVTQTGSAMAEAHSQRGVACSRPFRTASQSIDTRLTAALRQLNMLPFIASLYIYTYVYFNERSVH